MGSCCGKTRQDSRYLFQSLPSVRSVRDGYNLLAKQLQVKSESPSDRADAETMCKKAMETLGETKNRMCSEEEASKPVKRRSNGSIS